MPSYWVCVAVDAPNILDAIDNATAHGATYVDACGEPPQGSTIFGNMHEDGLEEDGPDEYVSLDDCRATGLHLDAVDMDGYCEQCGEQDA